MAAGTQRLNWFAYKQRWPARKTAHTASASDVALLLHLNDWNTYPKLRSAFNARDESRTASVPQIRNSDVEQAPGRQFCDIKVRSHGDSGQLLN